nr:CPBP family intramembrane glutamic endopeptidase [Psychrilyobacter atlanticus]
MIANCFLNYIIDSLFHPSIPPSKIFDSKSLENLVFIAFLIPLMEEVVFRGIVCNILKNKFSMFITILISGLIFATIHWIPGITFIITGSTFYFGYIYLKTKSLWNPVIVHVINNSIAALIIILGKDEAIETINLGMFGYIVGSISLLLCFYNFYRMYKGIHFEKPLKIGEIKEGVK